MKKLVIILLLLVGFGYSTQSHAQTGGKKREKRTKRRGNHILTQYKSHGHADEFARGSGRRGRFAKLFKRSKPSWSSRSTNKRSNERENRDLFARFRTSGRVDNETSQARHSTERSKRRDHGNKSFKRRKYRRQ